MAQEKKRGEFAECSALIAVENRLDCQIVSSGKSGSSVLTASPNERVQLPSLADGELFERLQLHLCLHILELQTFTSAGCGNEKRV